jgi:hypothetical protein
VNNKIIGFTISAREIDHSNIDFFKAGIKFITIKRANLYIYLWGIGDLEKCFINKNTVTLSFPLNVSLDDRNVLIRFLGIGMEIENDWLGSIPVFYDGKQKIVSTLINIVINGKKLRFHPEGLYNYLDFGFSVFEQTAFKDIKFLRHYSKLVISPSGIIVINKKDKFLGLTNKTSNPEDVIHMIDGYVNKSSEKVFGNVIIPTSGGYDSRLLNLLFKNKKRIKARTYGLSIDNKNDCEIVKARFITKVLKIDWEEIKLGNFMRYYEDWFKVYGPSVHLHGMYHIEFYKKIRKNLRNNSYSLLSGIIGDGWSGNVDIPEILGESNLKILGYSHSIQIDARNCRLHSNNLLRKSFYKENAENLSDPRIRLIQFLRIKLILLTYLMTLPDYFGFPSWTPFLNFKIVEAILNLGPTERKDRKWQTDLFKKNHIYPEDLPLDCSNNNTLDADGLRNFAIPNINTKSILNNSIKLGLLLKTHSSYRKLITNGVEDNILLNRLIDTRVIGYILKKLGFQKRNYMEVFNHLIVLKSLEMAGK